MNGFFQTSSQLELSIMGMEEVEPYERYPETNFGLIRTILHALGWLLPVQIRSLGDVSRVITFAKLNEEDLLPVTQVFLQL